MAKLYKKCTTYRYKCSKSLLEIKQTCLQLTTGRDGSNCELMI